MKLPSTYWVYFKQACAQLMRSDDAAIARLNGLVDAIADAAVAQQHRPISELFSLLGGMERTRELGFVMGRLTPITAYGGLALALRIAPTLKDVLKLVADYHHGETPLMLYGYEESAKEGLFTVGFRCPIDPDGEALAMSGVASAISSETLRLTGKPIRFSRIELTPSSREWGTLYSKHLGVSPRIDHGRNVVVFDRATLDRRNLTADPETFNGLVAQLERDRLLRGATESLLLQVEERVMSRIGDPPAIDALAKSLGCTSRKLRRLLVVEGTSYQQIVRRCRVEYAGALLANPARSISEIAFRLGFGDQAAFTHNFKRWTGVSPSQFRRQGRRQAGEAP